MFIAKILEKQNLKMKRRSKVFEANIKIIVLSSIKDQLNFKKNAIYTEPQLLIPNNSLNKLNFQVKKIKLKKNKYRSSPKTRNK